MIEYRDELVRLAAECREAARWSRDFQRIVGMADVIIDELTTSRVRLIAWKPIDWPMVAATIDRLRSNLANAANLAASCPDLPRYYLLGAADELDAMAGAPAETTEESTI